MKFKVGDQVLINNDDFYQKKGIVDYVGSAKERPYRIGYKKDGEEFKKYHWFKESDLNSINEEKPTINDLRDYMLDNFVDEYGRLRIKGLDFSEFEGHVIISEMKVKNDLYQISHTVGGDLKQTGHKVGGDLFQGNQEVELDYVCGSVKYGGELFVDEPQKILEEITKEELAEMGYKLNV